MKEIHNTIYFLNETKGKSQIIYDIIYTILAPCMVEINIMHANQHVWWGTITIKLQRPIKVEGPLSQEQLQQPAFQHYN